MIRRAGTGSASRPARSGPVAAAVAALALVGLLVAPAAAQTPPPDPAPTGAAPGPGAAIDLVSQTPFVAPTDTLRIDLDVRGAPEGAELTFTLRSPVTAPFGVGTAQARFDAWVDGTANLDADPFNSPKTFAVAALPPADGSGRINAAFQVVPEDQPEPLVGFQIEDPGVYPLTISLSGPEGGAPLDLLTTYLVRLPAAAQAGPPLTVAPIVDVRAPVALRPDGSRTLEPSALGRIRTLIDALDGTGTVPVSVEATPETLEALAATGPIPATGITPNAAATTGAELLGRLEAALAGRLVLGSTYVEIDVPAWTRSSMGAALAYQLSHGVNVTEAVIPDAAPVDRRTWVADRALTPEALGELGRNGIDRVVLPDDVVGPVDTRTAPDPQRVQVASTQPFDVLDADGTAVRAVAADSSFGQRLVATDDEALNAQILVADLAVTYLGALQPQINDIPDTPRGVAIEVPDDELALRSLSPFLTALATAPPAGGDGGAIVTAGTLADLFSIPPATVAGAGGTGPDGSDDRVLTRSFTPDPPPGAPEDMGDYPQQLDEAEYALSAYESMVVDLEPGLVLPLRQLLDVSGAAGLDDTERTRYLDAATATADGAFGQISIPEQDQVLLTVAETEIGIVIENGLAYPVTVRMDLASAKLDFPEGDVMEVVLAPGRNRLPVPVKTVSGGTFPLSIDVSTPDTRQELGSGVVEVRSTAISGLGLVLSVGAGFFLLVWWARNWRTTRRTTNAAAAATRAAETEGGTDPAEHERARARAGFTVGPLDDLTADDPTAAAGQGERTAT